ncbi:MAG: M16 family metallopeptidase [Bacteroidota bacterium]
MYHRTTLPNGLRIAVETIPAVESASVGIWVGAGSRDERPGEEGISHLIEHMFFKGTARRSARQIAEEIDAVGGQLNAFTTREYTCFYAKILGVHLPLGLELLADMYTASVIDPVELEKEKGVVLEEIRSYEDAPDEVVHDLLATALWPRHPLGKPILGTPATVQAIDREAVQAFLGRHYRPENTVLAVAGKVDFAEVVRLAEDLFRGLEPGRSREPGAPPKPDGSRLVKKKDTEQVHICLGAQGVPRRSPDKFTVHVMDSILGGSVSSRLFQSLREDRGLVYATGSTHAAFRDTGLFSIYAGTAPARATEVIHLMQSEIRRLVQEPIPAAELARAKEQLRGNFLLSLESTSTRMSRLAKAELFGDQCLTPDELTARIRTVTAADVTRVAREIFGGRRLAASVVAPPGVRLSLGRLLKET